VLIVALGFPVLWLLAGRAVGIHYSAAGDPLGVLVSLGGLMAAIFTVGGLVIALASLVTLASVEQRIDTRARALMPELEARADAQIEAHLMIRDASDTQDFERAERLTKEALEIYPGLHSARASLALKYAVAVVSSFQLHHGYRSRQSLAFHDLAPAEAPLMEAIEWCVLAIDHGEDSDGGISAYLALVYGCAGQLGRMEEVLQSLLGPHPDWGPYLTRPEHLIALVHACRSVEQLAKLGDTLGIRLPASVDDVRPTVASIQVNGDPAQERWVDWWVGVRDQPESGALSDGRYLPSIVRVFGFGEDGDPRFKARHYVGPQRVTLLGEYPASDTYLAWEELAQLLDQRFVFISVNEEAPEHSVWDYVPWDRPPE
jgi:hypothetical protein